ncbi:MAG: cobalt ECF transporter T component CbiQ [Chloroflexi bacterium]|nr:cobalt ECF transporter T component CbiQ [Chloroflexota bacterium]
MHAFDARLKFVLTISVILMITLMPIGAYAALLIAWIALTAASTVARLGPLRLSRGAFIAAPFLLAALPLVFVRPEGPLGSVDLGPLRLTISGEGLRIFTTIALKSWLSVQAALLLTFTTPFHDLLDALRELRLPRIMVAIISFMYRYLAVLGEEAQRLMRARAARSALAEGGAGGGTLVWRARVTGSMVGSLFLRSYERSERIYAAMQARGFEGTFRHMAGRSVRRAEWLAFAMVVALLGAFELAAHLWLPRL